MTLVNIAEAGVPGAGGDGHVEVSIQVRDDGDVAASGSLFEGCLGGFRGFDLAGRDAGRAENEDGLLHDLETLEIITHAFEDDGPDTGAPGGG